MFSAFTFYKIPSRLQVYSGGKAPLEDVVNAVSLAKKRGLKHAYTGNVFADDSINTYCTECGALLVKRYELTATIQANLKNDGTCANCGCFNDFDL